MIVEGLGEFDFDDEPVTAYLQTLEWKLCALEIEQLVAEFHANMARFRGPLPAWDQSDGLDCPMCGQDATQCYCER